MHITRSIYTIIYEFCLFLYEQRPGLKRASLFVVLHDSSRQRCHSNDDSKSTLQVETAPEEALHQPEGSNYSEDELECQEVADGAAERLEQLGQLVHVAMKMIVDVDRFARSGSVNDLT